MTNVKIFLRSWFELKSYLKNESDNCTIKPSPPSFVPYKIGVVYGGIVSICEATMEP